VSRAGAMALFLRLARLPTLPPVVGPLVDTAHLVSHVPVRPLARIDVTPEDFPFRDRIGYYRDREPIWISLLRA
jgi:hypothetical protein